MVVCSCRRYERAKRSLDAFDSDVNRYINMAEEVLLENSAETVKFLFLDCAPLKQV